jgi:hypothetical protein
MKKEGTTPTAMKNIRQPFLNELQATQNAFRLLARHRHQRLSQEE